MIESHTCVRFKKIRREGPWVDKTDFREREIEQISVCVECGNDRQAKFRKLIAIECEGRLINSNNIDPELRRLSQRLISRFKSKNSLRATPLVRDLGGVRFESDLERLALYVPIRLVYILRGGTRHLNEVQLLSHEALAELAHPGLAKSRIVTLIDVRKITASLNNPEAQAIGDILRGDQATTFDERMLRALSYLARLVENGEVRPARVFSTEALGDSKALPSIRPRLERLVGPLEHLGIRDLGTVNLVGGAGILHLGNGDINIERFKYLGLADEDMLTLKNIEVPSNGVIVVENLTPFRACLENLAKDKAVLVIWSAGFPGSPIRNLIKHVANNKKRIRVWCDLDLGGVRIARLIHQIAPNLVEPILMNYQYVWSARITRILSPTQRLSIERDLELNSTMPLADTLKAILDRGAWVEQESLIDQLPKEL